MAKAKQMTIVFKVSDNLKPKMSSFYESFKKEKTPPYAVFQATNYDTVITLYESGKVMFQGISADIEASIWVAMEKKLNNITIDIAEKKKETNDSTKNETVGYFHINSIGSDEVGTGDFFGPIIVTAAYVSKERIAYLMDLGVKDSKKLTDDKIIAIAPEIIKNIPHSNIILDNVTYNQNYGEELNMNRIKAVMHNKALLSILKKETFHYDKIVVDQFVYPKKYYEHLKGSKEIVKNIEFTTKAEEKYLSVAAASIISRYIFLKEMTRLSTELQIELPKGASSKVDETGAKIVKQFGFDKLDEIAKMNFKTVGKIKELL